jgi:hypothetical protein
VLVGHYFVWHIRVFSNVGFKEKRGKGRWCLKMRIWNASKRVVSHVQCEVTFKGKTPMGGASAHVALLTCLTCLQRAQCGPAQVWHADAVADVKMDISPDN